MIRDIVHAVSRRHISDEETLRRCRRAFESWEWMYASGVHPLHVWNTDRDATSVGDKRRLPFLKDVLTAAVKHLKRDSIILYTNDDIIVHPMLVSEVVRHVALHGCGTIRRVNIFKGRMPSLDCPPIDFIEAGLPDLGRDGVVFSSTWYERFSHAIPDFIIGAPCWDLTFAAIVRMLHGAALKGMQLQSFYDSYEGCEIPDGLIAHEAHDSYWLEHPAEPANDHNRRLFEQFCAANWPGMSLEIIAKQTPWPTNVAIRYAKLFFNKAIDTNDRFKLARGLLQ